MGGVYSAHRSSPTAFAILLLQPRNADTLEPMLHRRSTLPLRAFAGSAVIALSWSLMSVPHVMADDGVRGDEALFRLNPSPNLHGRPWQPVEQGIEDIDPLAAGLRRIETGLHQPFGFEQLFRVPGDPSQLMRVDGGLYAVFPSSSYAFTREGPVALIPSDAVFWIGPPISIMPDDPAGRLTVRTLRRWMMLEFEDDHAAPSLTPLAQRLRVDPREHLLPLSNGTTSAVVSRIDTRLRSDELLSHEPTFERGWRGPTRPVGWSMDRPIPGADTSDDAVHHAEPEGAEQFRRRIHDLMTRAARAETQRDGR
jgi:hypothetical protein